METFGEFTFSVVKASLIVAFTAGLLLILAWVGAKRCFTQSSGSCLKRHVAEPPDQHAESHSPIFEQLSRQKV